MIQDYSAQVAACHKYFLGGANSSEIIYIIVTLVGYTKKVIISRLTFDNNRPTVCKK